MCTKEAAPAIELWVDENEDTMYWDTEGVFSLLLAEHGSITLKVDDIPMLCVAPCLLFINRGSRVEYLHSTLLKATRIRFESVFINVNLTPERLCRQEFRQLFRVHHIDKLSLFIDQNDIYQGLLPLSQPVFDRLSGLVAQLRKNLRDISAEHWRCNVRDPLLAILSLAEVIRNDIVDAPPFLPPPKEPEAFVSSVIEFLHANYMRKVSVGELCTLTGINRCTLTREFKAFTGKTLIEYLLDCRFEHAVNSLLLTERTLMAISQECGFSSQPYFIMMFTRRFGCTPTEFRKKTVNERMKALNSI